MEGEGCRAEAALSEGGPNHRSTAGLRLGRPAQKQRSMRDFWYVYILQSESVPTCHYTGFTKDLGRRLQKHNSGGVPHTKKARPWRIKTAIAFDNEEQAVAFEKYLKSPSGRAFARKRL